MAGETTSRSGIDPNVLPQALGPMITAAPWSVDVLTSQLELNDVLNLGYIPKGATLLGFFFFAEDLDSNGSPALVSKLTVGATDVKTGITIGQASAVSTHTLSQFLAIKPITMTAPTLVKWTVTTAAATAAAGNLTVTPVYIGG